MPWTRSGRCSLMSGFRSNGGSMRKAAATSRRGGQSKQEIETPGSVDERPARDPEENAGGSFLATSVVFQIISVIFRIPSRIHLQRSTIGCRRLCVVQQGQCSEKCLEYLNRALERNWGTREEDSYPYDILDRDGSILYGSRKLLERVRVIRPLSPPWPHSQVLRNNLRRGDRLFQCRHYGRGI